MHDSGSHKGPKNQLIRSIVKDRGVLITSYSGALGCIEDLLEHHFDYVILDEGHKIRNPDALITVAVKRITTPHRIILSGELARILHVFFLCIYTHTHIYIAQAPFLKFRVKLREWFVFCSVQVG